MEQPKVRKIHPSARTSYAIRDEIRTSDESIRSLALKHGINQKTVLKWSHRHDAFDAPIAPRRGHSTVLSRQEEEIAVGFRRLTQLPLDDCLYALRTTIPRLTRANLYRCFHRHGVNRISTFSPLAPSDTASLGNICSGILEGFAAESAFLAFVAVDTTSRIFFGRIYHQNDAECVSDFLCQLAGFLPYDIISITFRGLEAADDDGDMVIGATGLSNMSDWVREYERERAVILSRLAQRSHAERDHASNYETVDAARQHMGHTVEEYNFRRKLKSIGGAAPASWIDRQWLRNHPALRSDPIRHMSDALGMRI